MARKREFDEDVFLAKAMRAFWRRGYVGTSMSDIYEATGLKPGSVYGVYGDKDGLFRRAFERYAEHFRATLPADLSGIAAIESWVQLQAKLAIEDKERAGCLIINTVAERETHSADTRALADARLEEIRSFFVRELRNAVKAGELSRAVRVEAQADALLGAVVSIMTLGRAGVEAKTIRNVAAAAIDALAAAGAA
jgi:TetR/AcrR family transcriptional repressor of nem operon